MSKARLHSMVLISALGVALSLAAACGQSSRNGFNDGDGGGSGNGNGTGVDQFGEGGSSNGEGGGNGPAAPGCNDASCACTAAGGSWSGTMCTLTENPGSVSGGDQTQLGAGGSADTSFNYVYPYDATVFPRGLLPPTLQFTGSQVDAIYVHVTASQIDYKGYFGSSNPPAAQFSAAAWAAITLAAKSGEQVQVDVTKLAGGQVTGPVTEHWTVAQGSLRGIIYYETYGSQILGGAASVGIMKIVPGSTTPTAVASGCGNVCHTASADGSTLVTASGFAGITSVSYNLSNTSVRKAQSDQSFVYGGLYPDGSIVMSATNYRTWLGGASKLYDTTTGLNLVASGWDGTIKNAAMPAFSPDGKFIVFNHEDTGDGKSLATMSFTKSNNSFTGLADVASDPSLYLGWPAFTPDSSTVIYHAGTDPNFETDGENEAGVPSMADLYSVDLATKTKTRLSQLDGYTTGGTTYLPAHDPNLNFAPTVLPEAVGGYFWAVFTSHRSYGNTLPSKDNDDQNGKLWVAAIDINAAPGTDSSHPAFYLAGQEDVADNLRGFWVLEPCEQDGQSCISGDNCCGGYCRPDSSGALMCSSNASGCSNIYEKCESASDCCGSGLLCINQKCAAPPVN